MGWIAVVALNAVIGVCYVFISGIIALGLVRTRQVRTNPLALATAAIFATCAVHHAHHGLHLLALSDRGDLRAVREVFGEWHGVLIDVFGAVVAVTYLGLRRNYKALLNTPAMFDDAVRLAAERHWRDRALTDPLTGIPNRAAYQQWAEELTKAGVDVTVLFVDLDGFKGINDAFGHDAGDRLLVDVAERLVAQAQADERVFRLGGDEFVVMRAGALGPADVGDLVRRVQSQVGAPCQLREGKVVIGSSIGVATGPAASGVDRLLREADAAMYRIKARSAATVPPPRATQHREVERSA